METIDELPDDVATLRRLLLERERTVEALQLRVKDLEHNVEVYRRMLFGPSSEKRRPQGDVDSLSPQGHLLLVELIEEAERLADEAGVSGQVELEPASKPQEEPTRRKRGQRRPFPEGLRRLRTTYELAEKDRMCSCGEPMPAIGLELSKRLERVEFLDPLGLLVPDRAGLGRSPRTLLEEFERIQSVDVLLPIVDGPEVRLRCVTRPDDAQRALIDRLGLELPRRLRLPEEVATCSDNFGA